MLASRFFSCAVCRFGCIVGRVKQKFVCLAGHEEPPEDCSDFNKDPKLCGRDLADPKKKGGQ